MTAIVTQDNSGIGDAVSGGFDYLAKAMAQRQEEKGQQKSFDALLSVLGDEAEGEESELGTLAKALKDSGVRAKEGLPFLQKGFEQKGKRAPGVPTNSTERETYKTNQKLITGIAADSRTAQQLLSEAELLEEAIHSKMIPGRGPVGGIWEFGMDLFNAAPAEVQRMRSLAKRTIIDMGDTKGIRLTDTKLKFLEDNLWNPRKSVAENEEAFRLWKELLGNYVGYEKNLSDMLKEDKSVMLDPALSIRISEMGKGEKGSQGSGEDKAGPTEIDRPNKENAKKYQGRTFWNPETGEGLKSNGVKWIKVGQRKVDKDEKENGE